MTGLPVDTLEDAFRDALDDGPVVVTSPTGSGKSTRVPLWCPGPTLVVEPRRVACRSLAQRVAETSDATLGEDVGYHVRDEKRANDATRVLFATPGVVLRIFDDAVQRFNTVVLDEFHERGLETDLLLALLKAKGPSRLVTMSATLDAERVARYLGGRHLHAAGRLHPVDVRHLAASPLLPDPRGLEGRVRKALHESREQPGDVLVFLPGKGEIRSTAAALSNEDVDIAELHGGLTLADQSKVFQPAQRRKVVLATNVAETSLTIPGIGTVIDSGLVRRTRYHQGRGYLTLSPIALDSADQRAGRAGRTGPGLAIRLWDEAARLEERTPPEIHREALSSLVLGAAACGTRVEELDFYDAPKSHAVDTARDELHALGALDVDGHITDSGRELFGLPLDAPLGRLLVEAREQRDVLADVIDLVAVLAGGRDLVRTTRENDEDDEDAPTCDAIRILRALRERPQDCDRDVRRETLNLRRRLRRVFNLPNAKPEPAKVDRQRLAAVLMAADPRTAHVARRRGRRLAFSNGGTEVELGRRSALNALDDVDAAVVLETRSVGVSAKDKKTLITCAMPVPLQWLAEAGLGRDRLGETTLENGRLIARVERVHARRVLSVREEEPRGELARRAIAELFLAGRIFKGTLPDVRERLRLLGLARQVLVHQARQRDVLWADEIADLPDAELLAEEPWLLHRLDVLGVENGGDLELLSASDLLPPALPDWVREELQRDFPLELTLAGAAYEIDYDLARRRATLRQVRGRPHQLPPAFALPRLPGLSVQVEHRGGVRTLREA